MKKTSLSLVIGSLLAVGFVVAANSLGASAQTPDPVDEFCRLVGPNGNSVYHNGCRNFIDDVFNAALMNTEHVCVHNVPGQHGIVIENCVHLLTGKNPNPNRKNYDKKGHEEAIGKVIKKYDLQSLTDARKKSKTNNQ